MSLVKREVRGVAQKSASFVVKHGRCYVDEIALRPKLREVCERATKENVNCSQSSAVHIIVAVVNQLTSRWLRPVRSSSETGRQEQQVSWLARTTRTRHHLEWPSDKIRFKKVPAP